LACAFFWIPNRTRRGLEGLLSSDSNRFSESVAAPASGEAFADAVTSFMYLALVTG
jgi:hypothetical protein